MSALRCLELENKTQSIPTSSQHLDEALGGGVCLGCITEITGDWQGADWWLFVIFKVYATFTGLSGSGKTQFCIQLTINTLLPLSINGEVVFISTTRSFCPQRVNELIDNRVKSFQTKNKNKPGSSKKTFTRDDALKKIHYRMVVELDDLIRTVYCLKRFTESNKNVSRREYSRNLHENKFCLVLDSPHRHRLLLVVSSWPGAARSNQSYVRAA